MTGVINRPETNFDGASHTYHLAADGSRLWGISSIAKMGEAEEAFSIASAWGFRIGYEGAYELVGPNGPWASPEELRAALQAKGLTPWGTRDRAAARGNWAHDLLERLATDGTTPDGTLLDSVDAEYRGHGRAILQWYLDYRPVFIATEVQVTSEEHGFAGRYDIRCKIAAHRLLKAAEFWLPEDHLVLEVLRRRATDPNWNPMALCLVDLKTSKRIQPLSHFAQLEGYELAGAEMGFPQTDVRLVLNTHPDGTYDVGISYASADDFLGYLAAYKAMKGLKAHDPEARRERKILEALLAALPGLSRDIAGGDGLLADLDSRAVGRYLGKLRKEGKVRQLPDKVWEALD